MKKTLLFLFALICAAPLLSNAQPSGWNSRMPITITENSGTNLYNYQVKVVINTQALITSGQMNANGDDILFGKDCFGTTIYPHWVDTGMNTTNTVIWVKVDTLLASSSRIIHMYYGNAAASNASSLSVFSGPHSSTDSVSGGTSGGVSSSQRGFRFAPNEDILVAQFGKNEPTGTQRYVTLFDFNTQAVINQMQVPGSASTYSYSNVSDPFWLTSGTQYLLILFQGTGDGYYYGSSSQIGQHLTYYDMRYCNSCTENTFPTQVLSSMHYGYPDLLYYTRQHATVEPTANPGSGVTFTLAGNDTVCVNTTPFTLTGGSPSGGTYSGNGVSGGTFDPSVAGTGAHTITYTYNDGICSDSVSQVIVVNACTGIEEISSAPALGISPNPASGTVTLSFLNIEGDITLQVISPEGRRVYDKRLTNTGSSNELSIDLSRLPAGVYFVVATTGDQTIARKLVKR